MEEENPCLFLCKRSVNWSSVKILNPLRWAAYVTNYQIEFRTKKNCIDFDKYLYTCTDDTAKFVVAAAAANAAAVTRFVRRDAKTAGACFAVCCRADCRRESLLSIDFTTHTSIFFADILLATFSPRWIAWRAMIPSCPPTDLQKKKTRWWTPILLPAIVYSGNLRRIPRQERPLKNENPDFF